MKIPPFGTPLPQTMTYARILDLLEHWAKDQPGRKLETKFSQGPKGFDWIVWAEKSDGYTYSGLGKTLREAAWNCLLAIGGTFGK